jgi:hypothetical protein
VDLAADVRQRAARLAQDGWSGPARDDFDAGLAALQRAAADLADDLRRTAAELLAGD